MYKQVIDGLTKQVCCIQRLSDGAFIPFNEENTDYQEYLKWLEAGNTPLPPEENLNGN